MSEVKTSTVITACIATTITGLAAYAVYFDYRRRNDLEFRRALKREARKDAKIAKDAAETAKNEEREMVQAYVDSIVHSKDESVTWPRSEDPGEMKEYFDHQLQIAESLMQGGDSDMTAAAAFFKAVRVYPEPEDLMKLYDSVVPMRVLRIIGLMEGYYRGRYGRDGMKQRGISPSSADLE